MTKPPGKNLVSLSAVMADLKLPGADRPIARQTIYATYLPALGIVPTDHTGALKTHKSQPAYITQDQARAIRKAFELLHWKAFRAIKDRGAHASK